MNLDGSSSDDSFLGRGLGFGIAGGGGFTSSISSYMSSSITSLFDGSCFCLGGMTLGFGIAGFGGFTSSISSYMSSSSTTLLDDSCICLGGTFLGFGIPGGSGFSSSSSSYIISESSLGCDCRLGFPGLDPTDGGFLMLEGGGFTGSSSENESS